MVSIIIPIYNVEKYLPRCLDSVKNQNFKEIEVIMVNDGSTDKSEEVAQRYLKDCRFALYNKQNGGLSSARNHGLKYAKGKYVTFIDSDDWIEPDFISKMVENISHQGSDFACCRLRYVKEDLSSSTIYGHEFESESIIGSEKILVDSLLVRNIPTPVWAKIYRLQFLKDNDLEFKEGIINEDTLFTLLASMSATKISFINDVLFNSLERSGSISRSSQDKLFTDMDIALYSVRTKMKSNNLWPIPLVQSAFYSRYTKAMLYNLLQSAQRVPLDTFLSMHSLCINKTSYLDSIPKAVLLPWKHKLLSRLSKYPIVFFLLFKVIHAAGFSMH